MSHIITNLLERIESLESKIHNIENRECCSYGSTKDRNIFEYVNYLLNFSNKLKKDLLYEQKYFKSRHNQMISQMFDKVSFLENKILNLLQPQVTSSSNSRMRLPCKICGTESMEFNKPENCYNSTLAKRYSHSPLCGSMMTMNDSTLNERMPVKYLEKLPFESKKVLVKDSSSDLSEYLLLTDSSSTSETSLYEEIYYSLPVSTVKSGGKPKYKRTVKHIVPVSIYKSKTKLTVKRMAPDKPKSKPNFHVESSNVQRKKKKSNKHKPRRKKDNKNFRLEKSDSQRVAVNAGQREIPNNKTEVFFVKNDSTSPLNNQSKRVDLGNRIIYTPYSKEFNGLGGRLRSKGRKVLGGGDFEFDFPTDQALYYVGVNPASSKRNKSENHYEILFNANEKHNSKTSIESQFIKSKWKNSIRNGSFQDNKNGGSRRLKNNANDYRTLGIEPKLNNSETVSAELPEYKFNSSDHNIVSKSQDDELKTTNEVYSVIKTNSNGDMLLRKLIPRDVVLQNENSRKTANGFEVLRSSIIPGKNNEQNSFSKPFGVNPDAQSVLIMNVPLYNNLPANSNVQEGFNGTSEPNITPDVDRQSIFGPKPSILAIDPNESNTNVQDDTRPKPSRLLSAISRHPSKHRSYINEEKQSLNNNGRKIRLSFFKESNKNVAPNIKNQIEPGSISNTPVSVGHNLSKQKKYKSNIKGRNVKSSRSSVDTLFNPNKKTKSGTLNNLKAGKNNEQSSFSKPFGVNPNDQSVLIMNVPLYNNLPANSNVQEGFNGTSEPNITPDVGRQSIFGPKPSILAIDPNGSNTYVLNDTRPKPSRLLSAISRHLSKHRSYINEEKESLNNKGSKIRLSSSKESNKNVAPNIKNQFEPGSISKTPVSVGHNLSKQKKSKPNIKGRNIKSSRSWVDTLFNPNKKTKSGTLNNLKAGSEVLSRYDSGNLTRNESKEIEIINKKQRKTTPLQETERISEKHIETVPAPKNKANNHVTTNQNCSKLNYSLHFEKERHSYLETNTTQSTFSLSKMISSNCNKIKSQTEIIFSEHKLNGKEYHGKVHEFFVNPTCCRNKKIIIPRRKSLSSCRSQDNCRCTSCRNLNFNNCHRQANNYDPTTDSSYALDWKSIAHKVKER